MPDAMYKNKSKRPLQKQNKLQVDVGVKDINTDQQQGEIRLVKEILLI